MELLSKSLGTRVSSDSNAITAVFCMNIVRAFPASRPYEMLRPYRYLWFAQRKIAVMVCCNGKFFRLV